METKKKKVLWIVGVIVVICIILIIACIVVARNYEESDLQIDSSITQVTEPEAALSSSIKPDTTKTCEEHQLVAENENYEMYLYEPSLSIIIRDKLTGSVLESTIRDEEGLTGVNDTWKGFLTSGVVVELQEDTNSIQKKLGLESSGATVSVSLVDGGFKAKIDYPTYQFGFELEVLLYDDGSFTAEIPESSIYEESETDRIGNIYVFPMLGESYIDEDEGYMFVPDGNGALIYLDDKEGKFSAGYVQKVYGSDVGVGESYVLSLLWDQMESHNEAESILAPIFGLVHTEDQLGYLAVIESGEEEASIYATPNGAYSDYNWVTAGFRKCSTYIQPTSNSGGSVTKVTDRIGYDIKIRYLLVDDEDADYCGMAKRYRNYLIEKGDLSLKTDDFNIRLDFLGCDVENWLLFKKSVAVTTADDIREIYDDLKENGVTDILTQYKGWQDGGIYDLPVTSFDSDSKIGGNNALLELINDAQEDGIDFYLYEDALRANPDTANTVFNTVKKMDKRLYTEDTYKDVFEEFVYWTPLQSGTNVEDLEKSFLKKGITNIALSGISSNLFTSTVNNTMQTRETTRKEYETIFESVNEQMSLLLTEPFECYWKYTNAIIDMPVYDSDYIFTDQSIPFLSIALKGLIPMYGDYVNFEANEREYFLKLVETGICPSFYLTMDDPSELIYTNSNDVYSSKYSVYRDEILSYYTELKAVYDKVEGAYIVDHQIDDTGARIVTYDNGVKIYINYSDDNLTVDGIDIPALSYKVGEAE